MSLLQFAIPFNYAGGQEQGPALLLLVLLPLWDHCLNKGLVPIPRRKFTPSELSNVSLPCGGCLLECGCGAQVLQQQLPLAVPDLKVRERSPIGHLDVHLSHILLPNMSVPESQIDLEQAGGVITIFASGVSANVSMSWAYRLAAHYFPWPFGDSGTGHIEIQGLQTGVSFKLKEVRLSRSCVEVTSRSSARAVMAKAQ